MKMSQNLVKSLILVTFMLGFSAAEAQSRSEYIWSDANGLLSAEFCRVILKDSADISIEGSDDPRSLDLRVSTKTADSQQKIDDYVLQVHELKSDNSFYDRTYWKAAHQDDKYVFYACGLDSHERMYQVFDVYRALTSAPVARVGVTTNDTLVLDSADVLPSDAAAQIAALESMGPVPIPTPRPNYKKTRSAHVQSSAGAPAPITDASLEIVVSRNLQEMFVYFHDKLVIRTMVTTGKKSTPTPTSPKNGWKPLSLQAKHHSFAHGYNLYHAIQLTGGYFMHDATEAAIKNYMVRKIPHSAGCVRVPPKTQKKIFQMVQKIGRDNTRVRVL